MRNWIRRHRTEVVLYFVFFVLMTIYFMRFFYDTYLTDMYPHCLLAEHFGNNFLKLITRSIPVDRRMTYCGWHLVYYFFLKMSGTYSMALGITNATFVTLSVAFTLYGFRILFPSSVSDHMKVVYTIALNLAGPLYFPFVNSKYYLGQVTPNPWHNPTTLAVKPFAIICGIIMMKIIQEKSRKVDYFWLCFLMAVSCLFKPSFAQMFIPAIVLYYVISLINSKGKNFRQCLKMAFVCMPTLLIMILQFCVIYLNQSVATVASLSDYVNIDTGLGIGISPFYVWQYYSNHILGSLILSYPYVIFVYIIVRKKQLSERKDWLFILTLLLSSLLPMSLLYNTYGTFDFDFAWGAHLGLALILMFTCIILEKNKLYVKRGEYIAANMVLLFQVVFGVIYFIFLYVTRDMQSDYMQYLRKLIEICEN